MLVMVFTMNWMVIVFLVAVLAVGIYYYFPWRKK